MFLKLWNLHIAKRVLSNCKSAIPPLFNNWEVLSSASDKANFDLDDSGIFLPVFLSRNNLKFHNVSVSLRMAKKVLPNLDSLNTSDRNCIAVVVLKNCGPELLHILAESCNIYLKECCFPYCWKVSSVLLVFKNVEEKCTAKNYLLVSLLFV